MLRHPASEYSLQKQIEVYIFTSLTYYGLVTLKGDINDRMLVNIGPSNGLVPDGTKPFQQPMLTYCQLET